MVPPGTAGQDSVSSHDTEGAMEYICVGGVPAPVLTSRHADAVSPVYCKDDVLLDTADRRLTTSSCLRLIAGDNDDHDQVT